MATTPGLGGGGSVGVAFETVMGTYVAPTVFVPVLSDTLEYTSEPYRSAQIRQQSIYTEAKPSYYHVEGDIELEVDPNNIVYFLYATRHLITKTGAGPYVYKYVPSSAAVQGTAAGATNPKTLSITTVKNGERFGFAGCTLTGFEFRVDTDTGVLMATLNIMGLSEAEVADPTEAWVAPVLYGADAHRVYLDAAGTAPAFTDPVDVNHNGFNFGVNFNSTPENRVRADRSASYIAHHITEGTFTSDIDFLTRADYDNFKAVNKRAVRVESLNGGATLAAATDGVRLQANNYYFSSYAIPLEGMGDLIAANTEGSMLGITGGDAYEVHVKSAVSIT
jgi:hypothetical protein